MNNLEMALITKVIDSQNFHALEKAQITEEFFATPEAAELYRYLRDCYHDPATPGLVPSRAMVKMRFTGFFPFPADDDALILAAELRRQKVRMEIAQLALNLQVEAERDPMEAMATLRSHSSRISALAEVGQDLSMSTTYSTIRQQYEAVAAGRGIIGLPYPWAQINEETQGMQPGQFIVLYGRPKSMKCVCEGQRVPLADGSLVPIEEIPEVGRQVASYTDSSGRNRFADAKRVFSGEKDCVEVTTESGLRLRTSKEHLYMVPEGYARIKNLQPGDYIATARSVPKWNPSSQMSPEDGHFLGLLVGDGNYTRSEVQFTNKDPELISAMNEHTARWSTHLTNQPGSIEYRIVGEEHKVGGNPVLNWLRDLGVHGHKSNAKFVPEEIFRTSKATISAFLAGLFDTDGTVGSKATSWSTASRELAGDILHLLMRFGIRGRIQEVRTNFETLAYIVSVYSKEQHKLLYAALSPYLRLSYKKNGMERLSRLNIIEKRNVDGVPFTEGLLQKILSAKGDRQWPKLWTGKFSVGKLFRRSGKISRALLTKLADSFESLELEKAADTDIIWEKIESIEDIGVKPCYDIMILDGKDPNFIVEGFVVHNSWLAIYIAVNIYQEKRRRVLYYSREMNPNLISWRVAACMSKVDYKAFRNGKLQPELRQMVFDNLHDLTDEESTFHRSTGYCPEFKIVSDHGAASGAGGGIDWLRAKIREFQPDLVVVDGMYLMKDDRDKKRSIDWKNIAHISQDAKLCAQEFNIPLIGVTQGNRKTEEEGGGDLAELAYADAFGQDADAVFRVAKKIRIDENTKAKSTELWLTAPGLREGLFEGIVIRGQPATDFSTVLRTLTGKPEEEDLEEKKKDRPSFRRPEFKDPRVPMLR